MAATTRFFFDTLFFPALLKAINEATSSIELMTFIFRISYVDETRARQILDALKAAAARGVQVFVILNYSRFEHDVCVANWASAAELAAAGVHVRMGPRNQTVHIKLCIIDRIIVFAGSHNITRGALSFNREGTIMTQNRDMRNDAAWYFSTIWRNSTPFETTPAPDADWEPVEITLQSERTVGDEIELAFEVNQTTGVDAFAAVADDELSLAGANMGDTVAPTERVARVVPTVEPGETVYLAVRAYQSGSIEATSNVVSMIYQPTEENGGEGEPGNGGTEPPPPEPLTAPTVTGVTQTSPTEVRVAWTFIGADDFNRFTIEQRDTDNQWQLLGALGDANAREWTGAANTMDSFNPFRVVVYNMANQTAASNEVLMTQPALTAPHLESVVAGLNGTEITVTWTFPGCENFHRFEIQKQVSGEWSVVGSLLDPAVRQWVGPGPGTIEPTTYRVVVFNMAEESAASNEVTITGEPPVSLQAPVLVSVTQIGPMGINVEYSHVTPAEFTRYEVQQRTNETWNTLATITTPETRSWSGGPVAYMDTTHPVRVVVFVQSGDSAGSDEMVITLM